MSTAETSPAVKAADATDIDRLATHAIIDGHAVCNPTLKAIYQGHNGEVTCKRCIATPIPKEDPMTEAEIAQRRIETLTEQGMYGRRDTLRAQLESRGLSRVAEAELHMLEEAIMQLEQARESAPRYVVRYVPGMNMTGWCVIDTQASGEIVSVYGADETAAWEEANELNELEEAARLMITAENLTWAGTGSLHSADHVAVIDVWQNVALCGVNIAGTREIRPSTLNLRRGCARELRKLGIDPGDIGIENDLA